MCVVLCHVLYHRNLSVAYVVAGACLVVSRHAVSACSGVLACRHCAVLSTAKARTLVCGDNWGRERWGGGGGAKYPQRNMLLVLYVTSLLCYFRGYLRDNFVCCCCI